jgi:hypothetical protein
MNTFTLFLVLLCIFSNVEAQSTKSTSNGSLPVLFQSKLDQAKMQFVKPEGLIEAPLINKPSLHYEYALKVPKGDVEIRYSIWPLTKDLFDVYDSRQKKDGDSVLHPNKIHKLIAASAISKISGGINPQGVNLKPLKQENVRKDFNADIGYMYSGPIASPFGQYNTFSFIVILHKDNIADAYIIYLFKDEDTMLESFAKISSNRAIFNALKFK